jgi:hypothetical protein
MNVLLLGFLTKYLLPGGAASSDIHMYQNISLLAIILFFLLLLLLSYRFKWFFYILNSLSMLSEGGQVYRLAFTFIIAIFSLLLIFRLLTN